MSTSSTPITVLSAPSPSSTSATNDAAALKIALPLGLLVLILAAFSVYFLLSRLGALRWLASWLRRWRSRSTARGSTATVYQRAASHAAASTTQLGGGEASAEGDSSTSPSPPRDGGQPGTWLQRLASTSMHTSPSPTSTPSTPATAPSTTAQRPTRRRRRPRLGEGPHRTDSGVSVRTVPVYKEEVGEGEMVLWKSWTNMSGASHTSIPLNAMGVEADGDYGRQEAETGDADDEAASRFVSIDIPSDDAQVQVQVLDANGVYRRHSIAEVAPSLAQRALSPVRRLGGSLRWSWVAGASDDERDRPHPRLSLGRTEEVQEPEEPSPSPHATEARAPPEDSTPNYDELYPQVITSTASDATPSDAPSQTTPRPSVASRLLTRLRPRPPLSQVALARSAHDSSLPAPSTHTPSVSTDDSAFRPSMAASRASSTFNGRTLTAEQAAFLSSVENLGRYGIVNLSITDLATSAVEGNGTQDVDQERREPMEPPSWEEIQSEGAAPVEPFVGEVISTSEAPVIITPNDPQPPVHATPSRDEPVVGGSRPPPLVLASERAINEARGKGSAEV